MSCHGCNPQLDCPGQNDTLFPYTLTALSPFQFIVICPTNSDCTAALSVTMDCCDTPVTIQIPTGASDAERAALVQQLISQCQFMQEECGGGGGGGGSDPDVPTPTTFYYNQALVSTATCSESYGGGTYSISVPAARFVAETFAEANALAQAFGAEQALSQRFCLNAPCLCPCKDVSTTINIKTVGGTGPFTFTITSGMLPSGMALGFVGNVLKLTGTPTVTGTSTITIKVFDSVGGYLVKNLTFYVLDITTSSLPDFTTGTPYSQQLVGTGGTGNYTFEITVGSLPDGLSMSAGGLISGTPTGDTPATFTVRMRDAGIPQTTGGCTQELTIDVASPQIYYQMEGPGPIAVDSFGVNDTDDNVGTRTVVAGAIGNVQYPVAAASGFPYSALTDITKITSKSCTLRFWVKRLQDLVIPGSGGTNPVGLSTRYFSFIMGVNIGGSARSIRMGYGDVGFGGGVNFIVAPSTVDINDGNKHRALFTYDEDSQIATLQLDQETPLTAMLDPADITDLKIGIAPFTTSSLAVYICGIGNRIAQSPTQQPLIWMDEIYIAPGIVWDNADSIYDWNAGAGRTYPDLPTP